MKRFISTIHPEKFFVAGALFFGLITAFITPPLQSPDVDRHFLAFDAVTSKKPAITASESSVRFVEMHQYLMFHPGHKYSWARYKDALQMKSPPDDLTSGRVVFGYPWGRLTHSVPQILGIWTARQFTDRMLIQMLAGRLANLLAYTAVVFMAIRIIPFYKWGLVLIGTMPMTLFLASTLSYDAFSIGVVFLVIAQMTNISVSPEIVSAKKLIWFLITLAVMVVLKFPYALIVLPALFLPSSLFKSGKTKTLFRVTVGILLLFLIIVQYSMTHAAEHWYREYRENSPTVRAYEPQIEGEWPIMRESYGQTSAAGQMKKLIVQPSDFLSHFGNTLVSPERIMLYAGSFGGCLGWLDTLLPPAALIFFYLILIAQPILEDRPLDHFQPYLRYLYCATFISLFTLIHVVFYIAATREISDIENVQGRYLIPFAPLLFLSLSSNWLSTKLSLKPIVAKLLFCGTVVFIQVVSIVTLLQRYYGDYWWERKI